MNTADQPHLAPTRVGPNTYAEPTAEQRAAFAAYLRGLAEAVENPIPGDLPVRLGTIDVQANVEQPWVLPTSHRVVHNTIGRQITVTIGWGTPDFGWGWR